MLRIHTSYQPIIEHEFRLSFFTAEARRRRGRHRIPIQKRATLLLSLYLGAFVVSKARTWLTHVTAEKTTKRVTSVNEIYFTPVV